jgi:phosphotransferase system HPr (HPr) family protein
MADGTARVDLKANDDLHLRPMTLIHDTAVRFASDITISRGGKTADAKSVIDMMALAPTRGPIEFRATGEDAEAALAALEKMLGSEMGK